MSKKDKTIEIKQNKKKIDDNKKWSSNNKLPIITRSAQDKNNTKDNN